MAGLDNENPPVEKADSESVVYLTLGDGDFTYSLDLARYMKLSRGSQPLSSTKPQKNVKLVLTGVDTLEALTSKYKDSPFILQDIRNQQDGMPSISLTIQHGINAIVHPDRTERAKGPLHESADHVLFHHPHLGTENCSLHKRFLAHLFFSVDQHWLKPKGGIFHLTLVEGQFERWKCLEQAKRHGLELLHKSPFAPPPVATSSKSTGNRYHYRRHQTGKSFATRRPNSRSFTYTFGRIVDKECYVATTLPWQPPCTPTSDTGTETVEKTVPPVAVPTPSMLPCPFCEKEFSEKRSLKCHLRDKHSCDKATIEQAMKGGDQPRVKKRKQGLISTTTVEQAKNSSFSCLRCLPNRIFQSDKALQSHIRAKHSGVYTYIAPDWATDSTKVCESVDGVEPRVEPHLKNDATKLEQCEICGFQLVDGSFSRHFQDFVPVDESQTFSCDFCSKFFREERAKLQHINFCSKRPDSTNFVN